jgi:hypothetical protein
MTYGDAERLDVPAQLKEALCIAFDYSLESASLINRRHTAYVSNYAKRTTVY